MQSNQPTCPDPTRLRELQAVIQDNDESHWDDKQVIEVTNALDWLATFLENRKLHHRKQQIKKKVLLSLAQEHGLLEQVDSLTNSALFDSVAEEKESESEIEEIRRR